MNEKSMAELMVGAQRKVEDRSKRRWLARAGTNVLRFPQRTVRSAIRLFDAGYRLEREARRELQGWLSAEQRAELSAIEGMSAPQTCELLAWMVTQSPEGCDVVEVGAWRGKMSAWLVEAAQQCEPRPTVVSIDPHLMDSWDQFNRTVQRFALDRRGLVVQREDSAVAGQKWNRPIGMLWIDGNHEYEAVLCDIDLFVPHVAVGGWIAFDDATTGECPGVTRAIAERMAGNSRYQHVADVRHISVYRRVG
jgi:predicted O-methyltransferase YrrM